MGTLQSERGHALNSDPATIWARLAKAWASVPEPKMVKQPARRTQPEASYLPPLPQDQDYQVSVCGLRPHREAGLADVRSG